MTEALNSVTYDVTTKGGFKVLFTMRGDDTEELLEKMDGIEQRFISGGATPTVKKSFGGFGKKPEIKSDGKTCPKCGGDLQIKVSSKSGKSFYSCSNSKYDVATGQRSGCDYFEWVQSETSEPASEKQLALIKAKWPTEYVESMSKAEANKVITAHMGN